jgi:hypothetical protein
MGFSDTIDITEQIYPSFQPNWIGGDVSASLRVVVAEVIVMETRLSVIVLARIYSDTSPPKEASFLTPLMFGFQRAKYNEAVIRPLETIQPGRETA